MKFQRNQVSKRLDHILRFQRLGDVLLALGSAAILLGIGAFLITVQYTPEQLAAIMRSRPWTLDIFLILPAPHLFRAVGLCMSIAGVVVMAGGIKLRRISFSSEV
jgi:hypothetical protein